MIAQAVLSITPGMLRHPVQIEMPAPAAVPDSTGHNPLTKDVNWVEFCRRRAQVVPSGGQEYVIDDQIRWLKSWTVDLRWDRTTKTITPQMRVIYGEHTLNIQSVDDLNGLHQFIRLQCKEST